MDKRLFPLWLAGLLILPAVFESCDNVFGGDDTYNAYLCDSCVTLYTSRAYAGTARTTSRYGYDRQGNRKSLTFLRQDSLGRVTERYVESYVLSFDSDGRLAGYQVTRTAGDSSFASERGEYTYRSTGQTERADVYRYQDGQPVLTTSTTYLYDSADVNVSTVVASPAEGSVKTYHYRYNQNGYLVADSCYLAVDGGAPYLCSRSTYSYASFMSQQLTKEYDANDSLLVTHLYEDCFQSYNLRYRNTYTVVGDSALLDSGEYAFYSIHQLEE